MSNHYLQLLPKITTLIFDVDGVLTEGMVTLLPNGDQVRSLNSKDGFALQLAVRKGLRVCIITGGNSENVKMRLSKMGITDIYLRVFKKIDTYDDIKVMYDLTDEEILYMGDDLPDYEVMQQVGIPTCPNNAAREIKDISKYISDQDGGRGCVRDVVEKVLRAQGKWATNPSDLTW
jgi:3-deoxy-D-manno-octulosonate 8-phosphate phosphatase (KDO 8-P phosphatase)